MAGYNALIEELTFEMKENVAKGMKNTEPFTDLKIKDRNSVLYFYFIYLLVAFELKTAAGFSFAALSWIPSHQQTQNNRRA